MPKQTHQTSVKSLFYDSTRPTVQPHIMVVRHADGPRSYVPAELELGGAPTATYVHDCIVEVQSAHRGTIKFMIMFQRHSWLPVNRSVAPRRNVPIRFKGDAILVRLGVDGSTPVNLRAGDAPMAAKVIELYVPFVPAYLQQITFRLQLRSVCLRSRQTIAQDAPSAYNNLYRPSRSSFQASC